MIKKILKSGVDVSSCSGPAAKGGTAESAGRRFVGRSLNCHHGVCILAFMKKSAVFLAVCTLLLGCAPQQFQIDKHVLASSALLDPNDLVTAGLCIMPLWNPRANAALAKPSSRSLEKLAGQKGFRRVRFIHWKTVDKALTKANLDAELKTFMRDGFTASKARQPEVFWKALKPGYFLQISIARGELVRLFDRERRVEMVLSGALCQVASRAVIWRAESVCRAVVRKPSDQDELLGQGVAALVELLPLDLVSPLPKNENW